MSRQVYPSPTPSPRLSEPQPKIPELQQPNARKSTWEISWWTLPEGGSIRNARLAGIAVVAITAIVAGGYLVLPIAAWAFVRALTMTLNGCIWLAASISSGTDAWTIVQTIGKAAAGAFVTPQVSGAIVLLVVVGGLALFGLQRLLGSEEDSPQ
jgi:hypothetical protein